MHCSRMETDYDTFFLDAERPVAGLQALETSLNLHHVTKAVYEPVLLSAKASHHAFNNARHSKSTAYATLFSRRATVDAFLVNVRNYLTGFLGAGWSAQWAPLGFLTGSLALPATDAGRCAMLGNVTTYFAEHPAHENAAMNYTATQAGLLCTPLLNAMAAVQACQQDVRTKRDARDAAVEALNKKISNLRRELEIVLEPTDPRWLQFFDRIPGDPRVPEQVVELVATAQPGGVIALDWEDTARAARYQVFKQVVGTDADFVLAETVIASEAEVDDIPPGATVKLKVVPLNDAGPGSASDIVQLNAA
jgi:hypothetical protein